MACLCDIRIASERARFATAYLRLGITPPDMSCYFLPRIVGMAHAAELLWTGRAIDAEDALSMGLVSRVVPHDLLMEATRELARQLALGPGLAIRLTKRLLYRCQELDFDSAVEAHRSTLLQAVGTPDADEGTRAFHEKREPAFGGE